MDRGSKRTGKGSGETANRFEEPLPNGVRWWLQDGVFVVRTGQHFSPQELEKAFLDAVETMVFSGPLPVLFDNRNSAERADAKEIRARADRLAQVPELFGPRIAVLVSDALHFGLARMGGSYLELKDGFEVEVFETPEEALTWLLPSRAATSHAERGPRPA